MAAEKSAPPGPRSRPRRSAAEVEEKIVEAAQRPLRARGFVALHMHDVALEARVTKAVYQRRPSKSELVIAVLNRLPPQAITPPSTDDVWKDLRQIVADLIDMSSALRSSARTPISTNRHSLAPSRRTFT